MTSERSLRKKAEGNKEKKVVLKRVNGEKGREMDDGDDETGDVDIEKRGRAKVCGGRRLRGIENAGSVNRSGKLGGG